jgi:hypothetical protein
VRRVLDEATIRQIVRDRLVRRLLSEESPRPTIASLIPGMGSSGGQEGKSTPGSSTKLPSGRTRGLDPAKAIAQIVGGTPDIDRETRLPYVGPSLGAKIKSHIESLEYVAAPYRVKDSSRVMEEWSESVASGDVPPKIGTDEFTLTPDGDGLYRYLVGVTAAEYGYQVTIDHLKGVNSVYEATLKTPALAIKTAIDGPTYMEGSESLVEIMQTVRAVVAQDNDDMILTKILLAGFSNENSTVGELLTAGGIAIGAVAIVAAAIYGGALLLGGGTAAAAVGGGGAAATGASAGAAEVGTAAAVGAGEAAAGGLTILRPALGVIRGGTSTEIARGVGRTSAPLMPAFASLGAEVAAAPAALTTSASLGLAARAAGIAAKLPFMARIAAALPASVSAAKAGTGLLGFSIFTMTIFDSSDGFDQILEEIEGTPAAILANEITAGVTSRLDELSREVAGTMFWSLEDRDRRDRMAAALKLITTKGSSKAKVLDELDAVIAR